MTLKPFLHQRAKRNKSPVLRRLSRTIMTRTLLFTFLFGLLGSTAAFAGTPNAAARYTRDYELAMETWVEKIKNARGGNAQSKLWAERPNAVRAGSKVWAEIRNNLAEGWTLEHASWLLENAPEVLAPRAGGRQEAGAIRIRKAVERYHTKSARVGSYCVAVTYLADPGAMRVLEAIERNNPDKRIQGAAALGQAILLRKLDQGGENGIIQKRQAKLRKAIIDGHDLIVGKRKLTSITQSEVDQFWSSCASYTLILRAKMPLLLESMLTMPKRCAK